MIKILFTLVMLLLLLPLASSAQEITPTVYVDITKNDLISQNVKIPLKSQQCIQDTATLEYELEGSSRIVFINDVSDASVDQILYKVGELTDTKTDLLKKTVPLIISGSEKEERNWYIYENNFRRIEGNIYSKNKTGINDNFPELIGNFKILLPENVQYRFSSSVCSSIFPIDFNRLQGYNYTSESRQKPKESKASQGPQLSLDILTEECKNNAHSINFKIELNHQENIDNLEYRIFLESTNVDSKKLQINAKRFSTEERYSFNSSGHNTLEIFAIANGENNSVSHESQVLDIDSSLCQNINTQLVQQLQTSEQDNNIVIFSSVVAFLIGLGLMALIRR